MRLTIEIDTDTDAFRSFPVEEVTTILEELVEDLQMDGLPVGRSKLVDTNGNTVGSWGPAEEGSS